LKGFIDLTFAANGRYHVADYKSNYLEDAVYSRAQLIEIMLAKRYDLQAALYALALHRLLQSRVANYQIEQHLGQAYYWFVRGAQPERPALAMAEHSQDGQSEHCQGMLVVDVPAPLVLALDQLFRGASVASQMEDFA
jgi:exodeoxyribonuclease V beta subunit